MAPLVLAAVAALANAQLGDAAASPPDAPLDPTDVPRAVEERWSVRIALGFGMALLDSEGAPSLGGGTISGWRQGASPRARPRT
jgi:hypothetical protein